MSSRWRKATRTVVAIAAAYVLALHAVVAGLAVASAPAVASFDPLHALCSPDSGTADAPGPAPSHVHDLACCLAHAGGDIPPPPSGAVVRVLVSTAVAVGWHVSAAELLPRRSFSPVGARAPPRLV